MAHKYKPKRYSAYLFVDKDPVIDAFRTVVQDELGSVKGKALAQIARDGGANAATLRNWFHGDTRRPQNAGIEASARALGYHRPFVKMNGDGRTIVVGAKRKKIRSPRLK